MQYITFEIHKEIAIGQNKEETENKVGSQIVFLPVLVAVKFEH